MAVRKREGGPVFPFLLSCVPYCPFVFCLFLCQLGPSLSAQQNRVEVAAAASRTGAIAALVGSDVITYAQLDRKVQEWVSALRQPIEPELLHQYRPQLRWQVIQRMVEQSLLLQEAKRQDIKIGDPQIDAQIHRQIEEERAAGRNIRDVDDYYRLAEEEDGISRAEFREELRKKMLIDVLLWLKVFVDREFIQPGELLDYYKRNLHEFQPPQRLTFRVIIIGGREDAELQLVLKAVEEGLDKGVPFEELARKYSSSFASRGGLFEKNANDIASWKPPLPEILRRMKPGEIRRRVATADGWYYLKMEDVVRGEPRPFEDVQAEISYRLMHARREDDRRRFVEKLRELSYVKIYVPRAGLRESGEEGAAGNHREAAKDPPEAPPKVKDLSEEAAKHKKPNTEPDAKASEGGGAKP